MRMVEFLTEMRPHGVGDRRVVPDAVADRLIANGEARQIESVFDRQRVPEPPPPPPPPEPARRPVGKPAPRPVRPYKTR